MTRSLFAVAALALIALVARPASAAAPDGKEIFKAQKCDMCHNVSGAGITATSKIKAPDLSEVAPKEDPAFLKKFLKKEADHNGKKHMKQFTGTDEELDALVSWLQKSAKK
jgi:mono/diheme cytochrome c family protein